MSLTIDLGEHQWQELQARADEVIPHDAFYSASETGFRDFLSRNWTDVVGDHEADLPVLLAGAPLGEHDWFVRAVAESYFSNPENGGNYAEAGFRSIGFDYRPQIDIPDELPHCTPPDIAALAPHYRVIVIGSGAGGGVVSRKLTEVGIEVLCIERGDYLRRADVPMDHLRNHRFARYGHNVGPYITGNPRVIAVDGTRPRTVPPHHPTWGNNAMGVGGGTRVWGAQAWRFTPNDFVMASKYGRPRDSSLADWPLSYADLAPHYDWAEYALGVAGEAGHRHAGARTRDYPMPPHQRDVQGQLLATAAEQLAWTVRAVPLAINSRDYDGRGPCTNNNLCVGFACPANARAGSQNTMLPKAMATGRFTLATGLRVTQVLKRGNLGIRGVRVMANDGRSRDIDAEAVILCAGAIESARLLWLSGVGNHSDHLGRHLQSHTYVGARGLFAEPVANGPGPGPNTATCDFNHDNPGIIGGGMLANDYPMLPIQFWYSHRQRAPAPWGLAHKQWMSHAYRRTVTIMGPVQEIPNPDARVTLDSAVTDSFGKPVVRLSGSVHPETLRTGRFLRERAKDWLTAAGAADIETFGAQTAAWVSAGQHQAGTCRMAADAADGVTDPYGRVHELDNLFVADASLHVTNGGLNPGLTVMALASRVADAVREYLDGLTGIRTP
jgi:choline dehydrogenase-like flavoprotein